MGAKDNIEIQGNSMSANIEQKVIERLRALPDEQQEAVLRFAEGLSAQPAASENEPVESQTLWAKINEIMGDVPDEVLSAIPADGSVNLDHYLYGASKKA